MDKEPRICIGRRESCEQGFIGEPKTAFKARKNGSWSPWMSLKAGDCSCTAPLLLFCSSPRSACPDANQAATGDPSGRLKAQVEADQP